MTAATSKSHKPIVLLCGVAVATAAYLLLSRGKSNKDEKDTAKSGDETATPTESAESGNADTRISIDSSKVVSTITKPRTSIESHEKDVSLKEEPEVEIINESNNINDVLPAEIEKEDAEVKKKTEVFQHDEVVSTPTKSDQVEDDKVQAAAQVIKAIKDETEVVQHDEANPISIEAKEVEDTKLEELAPSQTEIAEAIEPIKEINEVVEQNKVVFKSAKANEVDGELVEQPASSPKRLHEKTGIVEKKEPLPKSVPERESESEVKAEMVKEKPENQEKVEDKTTKIEDQRVDMLTEVVSDKVETLVQNEILVSTATNPDDVEVEPSAEITSEEVPSSSGDIGKSDGVAVKVEDPISLSVEVPEEEDIMDKKNQNSATPDPDNDNETKISDVLEEEEQNQEPSSIAAAGSPSKKKKRRRKKKKNGAAVASADDGTGTTQVTIPTPKTTDENQNTSNQKSNAQTPEAVPDPPASPSAIAAKKALKNKRKRNNRKKKNKTEAQVAAAKEIQDFQKTQEDKN